MSATDPVSFIIKATHLLKFKQNKEVKNSYLDVAWGVSGMRDITFVCILFHYLKCYFNARNMKAYGVNFNFKIFH